jgi:hypothetical protein
MAGHFAELVGWPQGGDDRAAAECCESASEFEEAERGGTGAIDERQRGSLLSPLCGAKGNCALELGAFR